MGSGWCARRARGCQGDRQHPVPPFIDLDLIVVLAVLTIFFISRVASSLKILPGPYGRRVPGHARLGPDPAGHDVPRCPADADHRWLRPSAPTRPDSSTPSRSPTEGSPAADRHLFVSLAQGVSSTRQLTSPGTRTKARRVGRGTGPLGLQLQPRRPQDGSQQQLYLMRADGGEARDITEAEGGVGEFAFTRDGQWLVYSAGKAEDRQVWALRATALDFGRPSRSRSTPRPCATGRRPATLGLFAAPDR